MKTVFCLLMLAQFAEPEWTDSQPLRKYEDVEKGDVLSDIESHMLPGTYTTYPDRVTLTHETTHFINNRIRNQYPGHNALYVLNNKTAIIREPKNVTLLQVSQEIPGILRSDPYSLYLTGRQQTSWQNQPLYLLDEWVAYTNGSECMLELCQNKKLLPSDNGLAEVHNMVSLGIFSLVMYSKVKDPDPQLTAFIQWNLLRQFSIFERALLDPRAATHRTVDLWRSFMIRPETKSIRERIQNRMPEFWETYVDFSAKGKMPRREIYYVTASYCMPCKVFLSEEIPKLAKLGYRLGDTPRDLIHKLDDSVEKNEKFEEALELHEIETIPALILIEDGHNPVLIKHLNRPINWTDVVRLFNHGYNGYPPLTRAPAKEEQQ